LTGFGWVALCLLLGTSAWGWGLLGVGGRRRLWIGSLRAAWIGLAILLLLDIDWPRSPDRRPALAVLEGIDAAPLPRSWERAFRVERIRIAGGAGADAASLRSGAGLDQAMRELDAAQPSPDAALLLGRGAGSTHAAATPLFLLADPGGEGLQLTALDAPHRGISGAPYHVSLRLLGGDGENCRSDPWEVELIGPEGLEGRAEVLCEPDRSQVVRLRSRPISKGTWTYRVRWAPVSGAGSAPRERSFVVEGAEPGIRVLLLETAPGWEMTFLRRALESARGVNPMSMTRISGDLYVRAEELAGASADASQQPLGAFEVAVVRDAAGDLPEPTVRWIRRFVSVRGGGLLILGSAPELLQDIAPIRTAVGEQPTSEAPVALAAAGRGHDLVAGARWAEALPGLPPLSSEFRPSGPALGARVLAVAGDEPFLAVRRVGAGRIAQLAGPETFRWRLRGGEGSRAHQELWSRTVSWLAGGAGAPDRLFIRDPGASSVGIEAGMRDAAFEPRPGPARIVQDGVAIRVPLAVPFQPGRFSTRIAPAPGANRVELSSSPPAVAWVFGGGPGDGGSLRRLALASGGGILKPGDPPPSIRPGGSPPRPAGWRRTRLRDSWWVPLTLLLLAAGEWTLRRRWGLEG
jgi:hypothetical protein